MLFLTSGWGKEDVVADAVDFQIRWWWGSFLCPSLLLSISASHSHDSVLLMSQLQFISSNADADDRHRRHCRLLLLFFVARCRECENFSPLSSERESENENLTISEVSTSCLLFKSYTQEGLRGVDKSFWEVWMRTLTPSPYTWVLFAEEWHRIRLWDLKRVCEMLVMMF